MKFDPQKLTKDLIEANKIAVAETRDSKDGGTCNLDRVVLRVPRINELKVISAIKAAGLYCRSKSEWLGPCYMFNPTVGGQGDQRTKAVEVMKRELVASGWDVMIFYQMD